MVDLSRNLKEETLVRKRLGDFLKARSVQQTLFSEALARIKANKWNAVIFGGVLRDLTILGPTEQPRDIDVVADVPQSQMEKALGDLTSSRNRFGGLRVNATGIQIDIWALESTWALRDEPRTDLSFDRLVSTTFLNAEAIAVDVLPKKGQKREIYSAGFFEAIRKRTLDISFEPNPYPQLCVVRSLITALRLKWAVSWRLAEYIVRHAETTPLEALIDIQRSHYGEVKLALPKIKHYLQLMTRRLSESERDRVRMDEE